MMQEGRTCDIHSVKEKASTAKECTRLISIAFPALEPFGTQKLIWVGCFLHIHTAETHTTHPISLPQVERGVDIQILD